MTKADQIENVSDTALWVATYRAEETDRPDALFKDPLAKKLVGDRGRRIAESLPAPWRIGWVVVIRTCIIDEFIKKALADGVDTILNLGAGLDTRPYRMELPQGLRWVEVDFPPMIESKEKALAGEKPRCRLERVKLDLSDSSARQAFLSKINSESRKVLVLTEGVIPYLSPEQVTALAKDLRSKANFKFWIVDFVSPVIFQLMKVAVVGNPFRKAPLTFAPWDWPKFFEGEGWRVRDVGYLAEAAKRLGRPFEGPIWIKLFVRLVLREHFRKVSGYAVLEPIL